MASCVYSLDRLHEATGGGHWAELAADARAWFYGRNAAGSDEGRVSQNSGAEANIVAAEALFPDALELSRELEDPFERV